MNADTRLGSQELGQHDEAVRIYKRVIQLDQDDATAQYNLGTCCSPVVAY